MTSTLDPRSLDYRQSNTPSVKAPSVTAAPTRRPARVGDPRRRGAVSAPGVNRPLAYGSRRPGAIGDAGAAAFLASGTARRTQPVHVATPRLQLPTKPAALVLRVARLNGPVFRDDVAAQTGLSISTVNRQVSALLKSGLIRERADLAPAGAIGRPRLPFELNAAEFLTVGIHIGYKVTAITTYDLLQRVVGAIQIPTPVAVSPEATLAAIGDSARRFVGRWAGRRVLWAGVALGGRVAEGGVVDHSRLGWEQAPVGRVIAESLGLPVSVASHVEAMAAAELVVNPDSKRSSFLYFYAREMVGISFSVDGTVYTPAGGPPVVGHFPVGGTTLLDPRRTGQLEATVSDTGVVDAALAQGLPVDDVEGVHDLARAGDEIANAILAERAEVLGRTIALVSDIFNPDHVILGGQAFTDFPSTLPALAKAVRETSVAQRRDVRVSRSGTTVQQQAAGAVSLDALYTDPLEALALTE